MKHKNIKVGLLFLLVLLVYALFPTQNSSLDAYAYAAEIKYGENLFSPHHLLYNAFLFSLKVIFELIFENIDVLLMSKLINSFFVVSTLFLVLKILENLKISLKEIVLLIIIVAFSFNMLRFGTENEAYVIPLFFSVLGSYCFLNHINKPNLTSVFFSGMFASIACLFHQIHFFWWLGLLIGLFLCFKRVDQVITYISSAIIVPVTYVFVLKFYSNQQISFDNLIHFVLNDYYLGSAKSEFGLMNFILIVVSFIRSFLQVHPNIVFLIKKNYFFITPFLVGLFWFVSTVVLCVKNSLFSKRRNVNKLFFRISLIILILHFLFSFYAVGNVEFLVMLPILIVLTIFYKYKFNIYFLKTSIVFLITWNFMFGIYPNNKYSYYNDNTLVDFIIEKPNDFFVVNNQRVLNIYYYKMGIDSYEKIILKDKIKTKNQFQKIIKTKGGIYTDIINKPVVFNRKQLLHPTVRVFDLSNHKVETVFQYESLYGLSEINRVSENKNED